MDAFLESLRKKEEFAIQSQYNFNMRAYERTKNPYFLWKCFICTRALETPMPPEFLRYLDQVASSFENLPVVEWSEQSAKVLGFQTDRPGPSPAAQYAQYHDEVRTATAVEKEIQILHSKTRHTTGVLTSARAKVAEAKKISERTVQQVHNKFRKFWG